MFSKQWSYQEFDITGVLIVAGDDQEGYQNWYNFAPNALKYNQQERLYVEMSLVELKSCVRWIRKCLSHMNFTPHHIAKMKVYMLYHAILYQFSTSWIGKHQFTSHPIKGTQSCLLRGMYHCQRMGKTFIICMHIRLLGWLIERACQVNQENPRYLSQFYIHMAEYDKEHFLCVCSSPYWTIMIIYQRKCNNLITCSPCIFFQFNLSN